MAFSPDDVFRRYGDIDVESNNGHIVVQLLQGGHRHKHRDSSNVMTTSGFEQHRSFFLNASTTAPLYVNKRQCFCILQMAVTTVLLV